jgi:hypothetical protein
MYEPPKSSIIIGWREWACFPDLKIQAIQFKTDTGAKTSALHAIDVEMFKQNAQQWVRFKTQLKQNKDRPFIECEARVKSFRTVTNSGGQTERRPVIETVLVLGKYHLSIELTLSDRSGLRYSMLLGRRAMQNNVLVNPSRSYLHGNEQPDCRIENKQTL